MEYWLSEDRKKEFVAEFRERLQKTEKLPPLTKVAHDLLRLRSKPDADVKDLVNIIDTDPVITLQVLRYCRLSHFGYGERIKSLSDAITMVLGYDRALLLAMGMSAGKSLTMQSHGVLGRQSFWQHSLQTAILCQELARQLSPSFKASPGVAYLGGLMHDIGFMLLGHMYPQEFAILNNTVEKYSHKEVRELELLCLGVSHDMVGLHLLRSWNMPEEICIAVGEHHFPEYGGRHSIYSQLVYLSNVLLGNNENHGGADSQLNATQLISKLQLTNESIDESLEALHSMSSEVNSMATDMAA